MLIHVLSNTSHLFHYHVCNHQNILVKMMWVLKIISVCLTKTLILLSLWWLARQVQVSCLTKNHIVFMIYKDKRLFLEVFFQRFCAYLLYICIHMWNNSPVFIHSYDTCLAYINFACTEFREFREALFRFGWLRTR